MPNWCKGCRSYFSVKTGTALQASKVPLRKWAVAVYLCLTSLKRAHDGRFHKMSPKHLQRYVSGFAGKHSIRQSDPLAQVRDTIARLVGERLLWRERIADNGLSNVARA